MAALRLVDRTGEFTIAQVADALGVRPSSLYNHLSSKGEIVEAMRSLVFREGGVETGDPGPWDQTVRSRLRRYRECFAAHQRLIPLVTSYTVSSPEVMGMYDELAETLRATGVPDGQLLDVITMCDSIVLGAALDLAAPDEGWAVDQARSPALIAAIQQAGSVANGPTGRSSSPWTSSSRASPPSPFSRATALLRDRVASVDDDQVARQVGRGRRREERDDRRNLLRVTGVKWTASRWPVEVAGGPAHRDHRADRQRGAGQQRGGLPQTQRLDEKSGEQGAGRDHDRDGRRADPDDPRQQVGGSTFLPDRCLQRHRERPGGDPGREQHRQGDRQDRDQQDRGVRAATMKMPR